MTGSSMTRLVVLLAVLSTALPAAARDWSARGPHAVGVRTLTWTKTSVTTGGPRVMETTIWYPTVKRSGTPEALGLRDAKVKKGRFPLVIYSHGNCGTPAEATYLTMALASWGFIVAAPPHPGNTADDGGACFANFVDSSLNRPPDIHFVLDQVLAEATNPSSPFAKRIRPTGIGMSGGSFGGFTTLFTAQEEPRFTAALANVPGGYAAISPRANLTIPAMIIGAENDQVVPFETESRPLFGELAGPRYLVEVFSTSHLSFFDTCGCLPTDIPQDESHRIILRYAVPFFMRYLKDGRAAGKAITQQIDGVELTAEP
jgi:predicted dienelactone hydrolase